MSFLDVLSPPTLRQSAITISLAQPLDRRLVFVSIGFLVAVDDTLAPRGLVPPIEEIITGPDGIARQTRHRLTVPSRLSFTPRAPGLYQVLLREVGHDQHYGALPFDVSGDALG